CDASLWLYQSSRRDVTGCQLGRDFVTVTVDLQESVVGCVRLGNIVAFDSHVAKHERSASPRYLFHQVGSCPTARVNGCYCVVHDVSSFSSIEKISPALSSRLRTMQVRLETSTSLAS